MPTPTNEKKEGENNAEMLELKRQLQEKDKTIQLLERNKNEQQQRIEHSQKGDLQQT